jgi:nucleotide-binding universal stress UspA family protein
MYQRILVPTDGTPITDNAVKTALDLARAGGNATLYTISVKEPFPYSAMSEMQPVPPQEFYDAQERIARDRVSAVMKQALAENVPCEGHTIEAVHPWEAIVDHASAKGCDLIVMASHGRRGMAAMLLGSETQRVLIHAKQPVLIVK